MDADAGAIGRQDSGATGLEAWFEAHGGLDARHSMVLLLDLCRQVDSFSNDQLRRVVGSLHVGAIVRGQAGGWHWAAAPSPTPAAAVLQRDIVERLGTIVYFSLTGERLDYPFPDEATIRVQLRRARPDVPPRLVDLVVDAVLVRQHHRWHLAALARGARLALHADGLSPSRWSRRSAAVAGLFFALAVLVAFVSLRAVNTADTVTTTGLTAREMTASDIQLEAAETAALTDEHTAAIQLYQGLRRVWRTRVAADNPYLLWSSSFEAWVRTLAGDRLTTEQVLEGTLTTLASGFGPNHPYVRTARLAMAATLEARGAKAEAAQLRQQVDHDTRALFGVMGVAQPELDPWPVPPGVIAHLAPNRPEIEGFRRDAEGRFWRPLTSTEHWFSATSGWRLHVVTESTCEVSFPVGVEARRLTIHASRGAERIWHTRFDGTRKAETVSGAAGKHVSLSVYSPDAGPLNVLAGERTIALDMDLGRPLADPPYSLSFNPGADGSGCGLVWLEVPYPEKATFRLR